MKITNFTLDYKVDDKFFWILYFLYRPFLLSSYIFAPIQSTVYNRHGKPEGILALRYNSTDKIWSIQLGFIPNKTVDVIECITKFISDNIPKNPEIEWIAHESNYPSVRLLEKLGGGFYKSDDSIEIGSFYVSFLQISGRKEYTEKIRNKSKVLFDKWLKKFNKRKELMKDLEDYLKEFKCND